jgi:hypothetical protein
MMRVPLEHSDLDPAWSASRRSIEQLVEPLVARRAPDILSPTVWEISRQRFPPFAWAAHDLRDLVLAR